MCTNLASYLTGAPPTVSSAPHDLRQSQATMLSPWLRPRERSALLKLSHFGRLGNVETNLWRTYGDMMET